LLLLLLLLLAEKSQGQGKRVIGRLVGVAGGQGIRLANTAVGTTTTTSTTTAECWVWRTQVTVDRLSRQLLFSQARGRVAAAEVAK
jgi:hypothetical protein